MGTNDIAETRECKVCERMFTTLNLDQIIKCICWRCDN